MTDPTANTPAFLPLGISIAALVCAVAALVHSYDITRYGEDSVKMQAESARIMDSVSADDSVAMIQPMLGQAQRSVSEVQASAMGRMMMKSARPAGDVARILGASPSKDGSTGAESADKGRP